MSNVIIINTLPVPSGAASVNRILSYSKGLVMCGDMVTVVSSAYSDNKEGVYEGVKYINTGNGTGGMLSLLCALFRMLSIIWSNKYDAAIIVSNSLLLIYPIVIVCKLHGIKIIQEKSEFPFVMMKKGLICKVWASFYTSTTYKLFDGLIVMTKPLMAYFKKRVRKNCKLIEVPMTVELERFDIDKTSSTAYGKYIAYCGDMAGNKDGVFNLIEAFSIARKTVEDIKLLLIGGSSNQAEFEKLKQQAQEMCSDDIIFYGRTPREEIPLLLKNAMALALARPSSLQSTGGFPTKLGEYLATGNPVIVTAVGDIPYYLNRDNSYIVQSDDNRAFADQIIALFKDYDEAVKIGKEGKKVAEKFFNSKVQSSRIHNFILELCE